MQPAEGARARAGSSSEQTTRPAQVQGSRGLPQAACVSLSPHTHSRYKFRIFTIKLADVGPWQEYQIARLMAEHTTFLSQAITVSFFVFGMFLHPSDPAGWRCSLCKPPLTPFLPGRELREKGSPSPRSCAGLWVR
jgi:hypothetical protein